MRLAKYMAALCMAAVLMMCFTSGCGDKHIVVGVSNGFVGNNWRSQMIEDIEKSFAIYKEQGLVDELIVKNAGLDINNQIDQIRTFIDMNVDLLMIDPNDENELNGVIKEAHDKGIKVIAFDQPVSSPYATNVVIDQQLWGEKLARWLCERLQGKGSIVLIKGLQGHPANENRLIGMRRVLIEYPDIVVIAEEYGSWDQIDAQNVMTDLIHSYPEIDGVLSQDGMALGVAKAYMEAGVPMPPMTGETFVGFLRVWNDLKGSSGFDTFAMNNPPGIAYTAMGIGVRMLEGKTLKPLANNTYYYPVKDILTNENFEAYYELHKNKPGSYFVDEWLSDAELDALFQ